MKTRKVKRPRFADFEKMEQDEDDQRKEIKPDGGLAVDPWELTPRERGQRVTPPGDPMDVTQDPAREPQAHPEVTPTGDPMDVKREPAREPHAHP